MDECLDVECVHVLGRAVLVGELQVPLQQRAHVVAARVLDSDLPLVHGEILTWPADMTATAPAGQTASGGAAWSAS